MDEFKRKKSRMFELNNGRNESTDNSEGSPYVAPRQPIKTDTTSLNKKPKAHRNKQFIKWPLLGVIFLIIATSSVAAWSKIQRNNLTELTARKPVNSNPVPLNVASAVDYKVYYPDSSKLPKGYVLDASSFNVLVKNGIAYTVTYDGNKKIVFSLQTKPTDNELASFRSNYIPLRTDFQTSLGQAQIGAYNAQTLVSLPVLNGPWIVITAPPDINQGHLKQVINSLKI